MSLSVIVRALNYDTPNEFLPSSEEWLTALSPSRAARGTCSGSERRYTQRTYPTYFLWSVTFRFVPGKRV